MRLIDADAMMEDIIKRFHCKPYIEVGNNCEYVHNIIDDQPTIEAVPVVHGEWIFKFDGPYGRERAYCSAYGKRSGIGGIESNQRKPYCPNCGADMRKGGAE